MRTRRTVFLTALAAILSGFVVVAAGSSTTPPGSDYQWAQPWSTSVTTPDAQPPAWIPTSAPDVLAPVPGSSYRWAQPWSAPVSTPNAQPPASIPTG